MKRILRVWDVVKYAKKDVKNFGMASMILFVAALIFIVLHILCWFDLITDSVWVGVGAMGMFLFVVLFLIAFSLYLDGKIYLRDLDKKGYIIPESRSDSYYKLSLLERKELDSQEDTDAQDNMDVQKNKFNKRHLVLAIVVGVITLLTTAHSFTYARRPHPLAIIVMFIITGILFWQSFNRFFKNEIDIEVEDSRWIRPRIVKAIVVVLICFFVMWMGTQMINMFPVENEHYYAQIIRHYKKESPQGYYFYLDRLPATAKEVRFVSRGQVCGVSFYVSQEELKDIQAYYEGLGETYVIHSIEDGEETFTQLCNEIKERTTYFRSEDYENCMVYEFPNYYYDQVGNPISEYIIMDTKSGEVGYGCCRTGW